MGNVTGAYILGDGSQLTNLPGGGGGVTSIIAGTGIAVDQATGAVTVTATGGGGGSLSGDMVGNISGVDTYEISNLTSLAAGNLTIENDNTGSGHIQSANPYTFTGQWHSEPWTSHHRHWP